MHFATFGRVCPGTWPEPGVSLYTGAHYALLGPLVIAGPVLPQPVVPAAFSPARHRAGMGARRLQAARAVGRPAWYAGLPVLGAGVRAGVRAQLRCCGARHG